MRTLIRSGPWVATLLILAGTGAVRADLVSHFTFDATLEDAGPGGNNGTFFGADTPTFVEDRFGTAEAAISFDGTDDYVLVEQNTSLPVYNLPAFTVAVWVKGAAQKDKRYFSEGSTTSNNPLFNLGTDNRNVDGSNTGAFDVYIRSDSGAAPVGHRKSARPAFDDTWHHVAYIDDGGAVSVYIDGELTIVDYSYTRPTLTLDTTTFGGILRAGPCCHFAGAIDDARIFDHALTAEEVRALSVRDDCPAESDTVISGFTVDSPGAGEFGEYTFTADVTDTSGDVDLLYDFTVLDPDGNVAVRTGPVWNEDTITLVLLRPGTWTVSCTVDDDFFCYDFGEGNTFSQDVVIDQAMVSRWTFDETLADAQPTGNDGIMNGGSTPVWEEGFDGTPNGAITFDGTDIVEIQAQRGLPIYDTGAYTVALWVKGDPQSDKRVFSEGSDSSNTPLLNIGTDNTGSTGKADIFIRANSGTPASHLKSDRDAFDGTWHHIAWVDEDGQAVMYIDGVRDAKDFSYTPSPLTINLTSIGGILRASQGAQFTGAIDDVRVYNYPLTPEEVAAIVPEPDDCPGDADTHCDDLAVVGPDGSPPGVYTATAAGTDDTGDPILYTFVLRDEEGAFLQQIGPADAATADFEILRAGTYEVTVTVDDSIRCQDVAGDATRAQTFVVNSAPRLLLGSWGFEGDLIDDESGVAGSFLGEGAAEFTQGIDCGPTGALALDGVDDMVRVEAPGGIAVSQNAEFTIAMWVKGPVQTDMRVFSEGSTTSGTPLFNLGTANDGSSGALDFFLRSDTTTLVNHLHSTSTVFDDTWHHIAWTDADGQVVLYVDGQPDATDFSYTRATLTTDTTTFGGILRADPSHWFTGAIDEARIFNWALSQEEVGELVGDGPSDCCPLEGDTHCTGLIVDGPAEMVAGTWVATATATDDSEDPIIYTFSASAAGEDTVVVGPQSEASASFVLPPGEWTIVVDLDDDPDCEDVADDASCSQVVTVFECPAEGDTHCGGLSIEGPDDGAPGLYSVTATATDDTGDAISYTFTASADGMDDMVVGPQAEAGTEFDLPVGEWTITVVVDDDDACDDAADDATCSELVSVADPGVGPFLRGDANADGNIDLSDGVYVLNWLFIGGAEPTCLAAANMNGQDAINLTSAVYLLNHLFLGGPAPIAPYPECGRSTLEVDLTLGCDVPQACE